MMSVMKNIAATLALASALFIIGAASANACTMAGCGVGDPYGYYNQSLMGGYYPSYGYGYPSYGYGGSPSYFGGYDDYGASSYATSGIGSYSVMVPTMGYNSTNRYSMPTTYGPTYNNYGSQYSQYGYNTLGYQYGYGSNYGVQPYPCSTLSCGAGSYGYGGYGSYGMPWAY